MARQPRFVLPGHSQPIIIRGNNRRAIFYADEDYGFYLEKLKEASNQFGCSVHVYVLMTNHVHLLLTPSKETSVAKTVQALGRYYVQYFNHCYIKNRHPLGG